MKLATTLECNMTLLIKNIMNAEKLQTVPRFFVLHVQIINPTSICMVKRLQCQLVTLMIAAMDLWDTMIIHIIGLNAPFDSLRRSMWIQISLVNAWALPLVINLIGYRIEVIDFYYQSFENYLSHNT